MIRAILAFIITIAPVCDLKAQILAPILYGNAAAPVATLTVDTFFTTTGLSPGTTMSPTVFVTGAVGNVAGSDIFGTGPITNPPQITAASICSRISKVQVVGGSLYQTNFATLAYAYDHGTPQYQVGPKLTINYSTPYSQISFGTISGCITPGANNDGVGGNLFTFFGIYAGTGQYAVVQLRNGTGAGGCYCLNIESTLQNGATGHTADINLTQGVTVVASLHVDFAVGSGGGVTGLVDLYVLNVLTGATIGHVTGTVKAGALASGNFPFQIVGMVDEGDLAAPGHFSYIQNVMFANTNNVNPLW